MTPFESAPQPAVPSDDAPTVMGIPFGEARKIILDMDAESARGLAISLLIQLGIARKYPPQRMPEGWVLVPVEPTKAMAETFWEQFAEAKAASGLRPFDAAYRAMLVAAQQ